MFLFVLHTLLDCSFSATTGYLFTGDKKREFVGEIEPVMDVVDTSGEERSLSVVVMTTISDEMPLGVKRASELTNWQVVVAGDFDGPNGDWFSSGQLVAYSIERQNSFSILSTLLPLRSFGRKNVAYLHAIGNGAEQILDLDDDNIIDTESFNLLNYITLLVSASKIYNPYKGRAKANVWPRGFPLSFIKQENKYEQSNSSCSPLVTQLLANTDPDVDAIYRLTSELPLNFSHFPYDIGLSIGTFAPFNAQSTLFRKKSFWALYLPVTVNGRVSDIWRGYVAQRIGWHLLESSKDCFLSFSGQIVIEHKRNPHNLMKDFSAESDLYLKTEALLDFLAKWQPQTEQLTLPQIMISLYIELFERGFVEKEEIQFVKIWLQELHRLGYTYPLVRSL